MSKVAFVFPGQGSQCLGMGEDLYQHLPEAKALLDQVNALVTPNEAGQSLLELMFTGPAEELNRTIYTQPAILAVSLACFFAFQAQVSLQPVAVAGHSLGEFSALVASKVLTLAEVVPTVEQRARLMESAPQGTMAAVLGLSALEVQTVLSTLPVSTEAWAVVANDNSPAQVVISGTEAGLALAMPALKTAKAKRVLPLPVGGAFHSPLMKGPAQAFATILESLAFQSAQVPVISNVDAALRQESTALVEASQAQMSSPVQWTKTMRHLVERCEVDAIIEFGPGKVLSGLMKKTYPDILVYNIYDLNSLAEVVQVFQACPANV